MHVECYQDPAAFEALQAEWEALCGHAVTDTIFLRPFWHRAWWSAYGEGKQLRLLAARDEAGRLAGVAPLFWHEMLVRGEGGLAPRLSVERPGDWPGETRRRFLHPVGGTEVSDYLDFVVAREQAAEVYAAFFQYISGEMSDWDALDLHCLPERSPLREAFRALAQQGGYACLEAQEEVCPILDLPADWDGYLAALGGKQRHELRRKVGKAEREASPSWRVSTPETLEADLALFFQLHEQSDPQKAAFWDERARRFFREIAQATQARGWLQLSFVSFEGRPLGSLLCFEYNQEVLVYNSGYNPTLYPALSPGLVLFSYVIREAIARSFRRFDFLRGNERYKYELGGKDTAVYRLTIGRS